MEFKSWEEPTGTSVFSSTGKDIETSAEGGNRFELAYWMFASKLEESLPQGGTLSEIYYQVSVPLGLSVDDTKDMLKRAGKAGYIKRTIGGKEK